VKSDYRWVETIHRSKHLVHLIADDTNKRSLILKRPLSTYGDSFSNWCRETASLKHPNLCECWLSEKEDGLLMPYYTYSLLTRVEQKRFLKEYEIINYCSQILDALDYLHNHGWWCVDLKTDHLFLDHNGDVKLIDYTDKERTIAYCAPEALIMQPGCPQSDLWSLGVVIVNLLTGSFPFNAKTTFGMTWTIQNDDPIIPDSISDEMWEFLMKTFEKKPEKRWVNAIDMKNNLLSLKSRKGEI